MIDSIALIILIEDKKDKSFVLCLQEIDAFN